MNFAYFPLRQFTEALGVTSKVKSRLQPFIEEVENHNMEWVFQMLIELYTYTVSTDCELTFKFNSLVALKILLDTCELPLVMMIEVYFLPHVRRVATYQLQASQKHRGLDYFQSMGYKDPQVKKLGYNYVRLASQIVAMMAAVKPYRLYRDEELPEASEFVNVLEIMRARQWKEYDILAFYQVDQSAMRDTFLRKLKCFEDYMDIYYDFLDTYLDKFIRKEYSPKVLDPKKILQAGEVFACNHVLQELIEYFVENRASIKTNVLRLFTDFVKWGYIRAAYLIECSGMFDQLLNQAKMAKGGKGAFRNINGSEEQRKNLYCQVVRSLQIWAVCIPKNPMNLKEESRSSLIYKQFLKERAEVPFSGNIKKIRDEFQGNLQKNRLINLLLMKEMKKNDFDASKMRINTSNLEELIILDKNMGMSLTALIMDDKFINSLTTQKVFSSSSHQISPEHQQSKNDVPEFPSDDENFSEEFDQKLHINQLRCFNSKNSFSTMRVSKKMADSLQLNTVKHGKQHKQGSMMQFFQETVRTPTNSITSSNFIVQVTKPSPFKEQPKDQHTSTLLKRQKGKATLINFHQRLGFPIRRNRSTVAPEMPKGKKTLSYSNLQDEQSKENGCFSIDQTKFVPFFKEFAQIQGKKALLRNKDILLKTSKIEIGFIFEMRTHQTSLLTIFITPEEQMSNVKWEVNCPPTVSCSEKGEKPTQIAKHKQRRLMLQFWVKPPYSLPILTLKYEMEGKEQRHHLFLPISFNKFFKYLPQTPSLVNPITLRTSIQKINTNGFQMSQLPSLFPDFTIKKQRDTMQLIGGVQYDGKLLNLSLKIRQWSHIQISCQVQQSKLVEVEAVQFLMAVLLNALKK